jgi:hypothetical protein
LWFTHQNPYDTNLFFPTWHAAGAPLGPVYSDVSSLHPVYPPPTLIVVLPLALLPWPTAVKALVVLTTVCWLAAVLLLARFLPGTWRDPWKPLFLAFAIAFAPPQTALHVVNLTGLAGALLLLALLRIERKNSRSDLLLALLLTIAICLKPTIGLLLLPLLVVRRQWGTLAATIGACALITAAAMPRLLALGDAWRASYTENIAVVFTHGGAADISAQNHNRFDRIDLQVPFYVITHSSHAASVLAFAVACVLFGIWLWRTWPAKHCEPLLAASALLAVGLIPFYQRFYSAVVLLPAALFAFRIFSRRLRAPSAWAILALCSIFLTNTEVLVRTSSWFGRSQAKVPTLADAFIGPHLCWLIAALSFLLIRELGRTVEEC